MQKLLSHIQKSEYFSKALYSPPKKETAEGNSSLGKWEQLAVALFLIRTSLSSGALQYKHQESLTSGHLGRTSTYISKIKLHQELVSADLVFKGTLAVSNSNNESSCINFCLPSPHLTKHQLKPTFSSALFLPLYGLLSPII